MSQDLVDRHVVWLAGDFVEELERKADSEQMGTGKAGQKAVVVAAPTAKPMPIAVECHAGNEGKFYLIVARWGEKLPLRLQDMEGSLAKAVRTLVVAQLQVVAHDHGQEHRFPCT